MKKILILFIGLALFFSCSDEEDSPVPVEETQIMPVITDNIDELKAELIKISSDIQEKEDVNSLEITAILKDNKLFESFNYKFIYEEGFFKSMSLTYKYRSNAVIDKAAKDKIRNYLLENGTIIL